MPLGDFTNQAEAYGKARPGYPDELIEALITDAGLHSPELNRQRENDSPILNPSHIARQKKRENGSPILNPSQIAREKIVDLGAGTGILTRMLVERGFEVTAVEPNDSMRVQANLPKVRWVSGTFEETGLETESQDWAVAAQAFHWADPPRCLPEMRRILKPGCLFTVLWNNRVPLDGDLVDWTQSAIKRYVPEFDEAYRSMDNERILESTGDFKFVRKREVIHTVVMSYERYLDLWRSHNRLNTIAGSERFQRFFHDLKNHLNDLRTGYVDVRYSCSAWSARRND